MNFEKSEIKDQRSEQNSQLSTLNSQCSVELHIEELILHGFASGDRFAVGDAVERELARLFGEQGLPVALRSQSATDEMTGAVFNSAQNAKPRAIGRQIAQAVYQGFGK